MLLESSVVERELQYVAEGEGAFEVGLDALEGETHGGNWGKLESGGNGQPNNDPKWANQGTGHTEQKALHLLNTNKDARDALRNGGTAKMGGDYPPCPKSHRKMEKWAQKKLKGTDGKIEYHYPVKQKITYTGKGDPKVRGSGTSASGSGAQKLKQEYDKKQVSDPNKPEGQRTPASREYQKQKAAAERAADSKKPDEKLTA